MKNQEHITYLSENKHGNTPLHFETFCLNELMNEMKIYTEKELEKAGKSNVHVEIFKDYNSKNWVHTDRNCLRQILSILLDNAVKHTHRGAILFDYQLPLLFPVRNNIKFFVDDTGNGIHNENDLNLSIAQGLIQQLGGEMEVRPTDDAGTSVGFNIVCMPFNLPEN
jgi:signal transduction histidine kinase